MGTKQESNLSDRCSNNGTSKSRNRVAVMRRFWCSPMLIANDCFIWSSETYSVSFDVLQVYCTIRIEAKLSSKSRVFVNICHDQSTIIWLRSPIAQPNSGRQQCCSYFAYQALSQRPCLVGLLLFCSLHIISSFIVDGHSTNMLSPCILIVTNFLVTVLALSYRALPSPWFDS